MEWRTSWRRRWIVSSGSWNVLTGFLTKNFTPLVTKHFKPQVKTVLLTQNIMPLVKTGLLANNFMLLVVLTFPLRETHLVMLKGGVHLMQTPLVLTFPLMETHLVTRKGQLHMMQTPLVLTFPLMETHLVTLKGLRLLPKLPTVTWASMGPPQTLVKPAPRHKTLLTALAFWEEDEHVVLRADHGHDGACNSSWARLVVVFPGHFARLSQNVASVFC